jgi:hypothetical protein
MAGEPLKSQRITGKLLMFDQRRGASVHRPQRGHVRSGNAESFAQVPPQLRWHHPHRIEESAAHAQKPNLQGESELELRPPAFLDDPGLLGRELEEHLDLEGRHLARQVPQTQKCRVPAVHCAPPSSPHNTPRQKAISKSLNPNRESASAPQITGKCYRMLLH